jgi:hypothetical protein
MRRIVPRESRDLHEHCDKILRFAQDDLLAQVRFLLAVEMTDATNTTFYGFINDYSIIIPFTQGELDYRNPSRSAVPRMLAIRLC